MNTISRITIYRPNLNTLMGLFFSILIIFLQAGYSYYFSVQILALIFVLILIIASNPSLIKDKHLVFVIILLPIFIGTTSYSLPLAISRNSSNILFTYIGIFLHAVFIICLPNLRFKSMGAVLFLFRYASAATVVLLACLIFLTDSHMFPFLSRETLLLQNSELITNYSSLDVLVNDLQYRAIHDLQPRLDLFYGESSYLAIVIFSCVVCYMLTSRLILDFYFYNGNMSLYSKFLSKEKYSKYIILLGIVSLLYVQSFSSIIYALLVLSYVARTHIGKLLKPSILISLIVFVIIFSSVFIDSLDYIIYRVLTIQDSLSASQRFGSLLDFDFSDYLFGLDNNSGIPDQGFHNSLFYLIAISGVAGIYYLIYLLRTVYLLAKPVGMSVLLVLLILALIMQNGAVFSPNKVVLLSLILLPLSCVRSIYTSKSNLRGISE